MICPCPGDAGHAQRDRKGGERRIGGHGRAAAGSKQAQRDKGIKGGGPQEIGPGII